MKKHKLALMYGLWALLYIGAVVLSLVCRVTPVLWAYSVVFFLPGVFLAAWAVKEKDARQLKALRILSGTVLALTAALLVVNFLCVTASAQVGRILNSLLILVSVPMMLSPSWALSLFLWACLLMATVPGFLLPGKKKKK